MVLGRCLIFGYLWIRGPSATVWARESGAFEEKAAKEREAEELIQRLKQVARGRGP